LFVPTLVLVEIGDLARRGIVRLSGSVTAWTRGLLGSAGSLPRSWAWYSERKRCARFPERTDRLIAATAAELDYPLITRDRRIREAGVNVIW
jgi:PIN domain nuclease of toxin-antitoxin system